MSSSAAAIAIDRALERRERIFELLETARRAGAVFAPVSHIDSAVKARQPRFLLKHDIHALALDSLLEFASLQADRGIAASYFFMAPEHPLTRRAYSFAEQAEAMRRIGKMGFEIGIHLDPFFLIRQEGRPLEQVVSRILERFALEGIEFGLGNTHGNSACRHPDRNGFETAYDLFSEVARQPDFPALKDVPLESASIIRRQRVRLADFGFSVWADMPLWTARQGFVTTAYLSDNPLGKRGTLRIAFQRDGLGGYRLADRQPPDSLSTSPQSRFLACPTSKPLQAASTDLEVPLESDDCRDWISDLATHPALMLIHPQFYCRLK